MTDLSRRALIALGAALPLSTLARAAEGDFQRRAAGIFAPLIKAHDIPGLVVGLSREGRHEFFAAGLTARKDGRPVDADTLFELGSVSKTFNVALAALASLRGRLALDKPLSEVLPHFKGTAFGALTPIDLATHATGGMPLQVPDGVKTDAALMDWLAAWKPAALPETRRAYSNISIGMLGRVTASALGTSYTEAAQGTLFPMLGLKGTFIDVPAAARARYAQGYNRANKPVRVTPGLLDAEAYGVKSSARDMLRFLDAHLGNIDIPPELSRALAFTRTGYFETAPYVQDMVWEQYPWPVGLDRLIAGNSMDMALKSQPITRLVPPLTPQKDVFINKTGSTAGFGAYAVMLPAQRTGLVILANRGYPNGERAKAAYGLIEALAAR